ncbi:MAG: hypothetical protein ACQEVA_19850 [Myxococcota bacterium]
MKGKTNEYETILETLRALFSGYGRSKMVEMVTFDAGNTRPEAADYIRSKGAHYFLALRSNQGAIHKMALEEMAQAPGNQAADLLRQRRVQRPDSLLHGLAARPARGPPGLGPRQTGDSHRASRRR